MRKSLYLKILVPLDGSEFSSKALEHACAISKTFDSQLVLIYVVDKSLPINLLDRTEYLKILRHFGKNVLKKGHDTALRNGIDSKSVLKEGNVVNEIVKFAKKENCNLIVVGNKGLGAVAKFFLGSVSSKLASSSPCSVFIVK